MMKDERIEMQTSPPPTRLRRLGVRQHEDHELIEIAGSKNCTQKKLTNEKSQDLPKRLSYNSQLGTISPSSRQLKRLLSMNELIKQHSEEGSTSLNPLGRTHVLKCTLCGKLFLSFHGYDMHLETHDGCSLRCWKCNIRFNSNKSLIQHQRQRHKENDDMLTGFHGLIFIDFSCDKFSDICRNFCEKNSTIVTGQVQSFHCTSCNISFPTGQALELHNSQHHYCPSKFICNHCNQDYYTKSKLENHKQLFPGSVRKHLNDTKRTFIRALSLIPICQTHSLRTTRKAPAINYGYYERLKDIQSVTLNLYASDPLPSTDPENGDVDTESTSSSS